MAVGIIISKGARCERYFQTKYYRFIKYQKWS